MNKSFSSSIVRAVRQSRSRIGMSQVRTMADNKNSVHKAAEEVGKKVDSSPENPNMFSSAGAVGKQFNPDGNIGQIGEKIGGPFSKDGVIGSQFDASKGGIAGTVEKAVDGPSNPATKK